MKKEKRKEFGWQKELAGSKGPGLWQPVLTPLALPLTAKGAFQGDRRVQMWIFLATSNSERSGVDQRTLLDPEGIKLQCEDLPPDGRG